MTLPGWRSASTIAFWSATSLIVLAQLCIVTQGVFFMRLWEDEAFNLTVPINMVHGLGYTSDGTLSGSQLSTFDPRISTGPVVLLPIAALIALGADPVIGGRMVVLLFYVALLVGLWVLGGRLGGQWASLAAVVAPLGWNTWRSGSPIQSPVDILGEVPAAALLVWAFIVARKRPWLTGLFIGLAMQTKLLGALAAIPIGLVVLLLSEGKFLRRLMRLAVCALVAVVPNVLYELWKLVVLGPAAYWANLREFYWFFRSGGQNISPVPPSKKLVLLGDGWFSPTWLTLLAAAAVLICVILCVIQMMRNRGIESDAEYEVPERAIFGVAGVLGLVVWSGWWMASTHTPTWPRYAAMEMYIFVPIVVAVAIGVLKDAAAPGQNATLMRIVTGAAVGILVVTLGVQLWGHLRIADKSRFGETLADQRAIAADVAEYDLDVIVTSWGPTVSIVVLAGSHAALDDVPEWIGTPELWQNWDLSESGQAAFSDKIASQCEEVGTTTERYALCLSPKEP